MAKSSRKTKRTWVKNIDLKDLEDNLESQRDKQRLIGDESEFFIDESNESIKNLKKLKSSEILTNKSKVPALSIERNKKPKGKVVKRLMDIAGRTSNTLRLTEEKLNNKIDSDIWESSEGTSVKKPKTMDVKPLALDGQTDDLHAGKSYNPSLSSWKDLINLEFDTEKIKELNRQQLIERQEMLAQMLAEEVESEDEDEEEEEEEQQPEEDKFKLSLNQPTKWKKKTKTQRNKQARHENRMKLENQLKELKQQIHQLNQLDEINETNEKKQPVKAKIQKKPKKLFKYNTMEKPLEVKLSSELSSNLKNLKSEGNLFYSSMVNLQSKGLIESRIAVAKKRKYKPKITEKWSYKDFK